MAIGPPAGTGQAHTTWLLDPSRGYRSSTHKCASDEFFPLLDYWIDFSSDSGGVMELDQYI